MTALEFPFRARKTAQAAAWLLHLSHRRRTMLEIIKLLYLADRHLLREAGHTLTGDKMVSMDKGPVLSTTYDLLRRERPDRAEQVVWDEYIDVEAHNFRAARVPHPSDAGKGVYDELSKRDIGTLATVLKVYGRWSVSRLIEYGHQLPEWADPSGSSLPIDPKLILRDANWKHDDIEDAIEDAAAGKALATAIGAC